MIGFGFRLHTSLLSSFKRKLALHAHFLTNLGAFKVTKNTNELPRALSLSLHGGPLPKKINLHPKVPVTILLLWLGIKKKLVTVE